MHLAILATFFNGLLLTCQRFAREGVKRLKDKPGGRKVGEHRALSEKQEAEIRKLMTDKTPDRLKLGFALWNRQAEGRLIQERYGVRLTPQGVVKYLARRGFTPQKPLKRAYEQRPQAGGGKRSPREGGAHLSALLGSGLQ